MPFYVAGRADGKTPQISERTVARGILLAIACAVMAAFLWAFAASEKVRLATLVVLAAVILSWVLVWALFKAW